MGNHAGFSRVNLCVSLPRVCSAFFLFRLKVRGRLYYYSCCVSFAEENGIAVLDNILFLRHDIRNLNLVTGAYRFLFQIKFSNKFFLLYNFHFLPKTGAKMKSRSSTLSRRF